MVLKIYVFLATVNSKIHVLSLLFCIKIQSYQAGTFRRRIILPFRRSLLLVQDGRHLSHQAPIVQKVDSAIHWLNL